MKTTEKLLLNIIRESDINLNADIDWAYFIELVEIHKVAGVVFSKISSKYRQIQLPHEVMDILENRYYANNEKYRIYNKEFSALVDQFRNSRLNVVPVKGISLIRRIYDNPGERSLNDFDFLILKNEKTRVVETLHASGYIEGELKDNDIVMPINRKNDIYVRLFTDGLNPFYKITSEGVFMCDIRLRLNGETNPVDQMISNSYLDPTVGILVLNVEDELLYLCEHLYREVTSIASIYNHKDIILIKFIDIYEYYCKYKASIDVYRLIEKAQKYKLEKCLYYTLYYLEELYQTKEFSVFIDKLPNINIRDVDVIGINDLGKGNYIIPQKDFWERLFSMDNLDEVKVIPHWKDI